MNKNSILVSCLGCLSAILLVVPTVYVAIYFVSRIDIDWLNHFENFLKTFCICFWPLLSILLGFICLRLAVYFEHRGILSKNDPPYTM